jgi:hypothetical protein
LNGFLVAAQGEQHSAATEHGVAEHRNPGRVVQASDVGLASIFDRPIEAGQRRFVFGRGLAGELGPFGGQGVFRRFAFNPLGGPAVRLGGPVAGFGRLDVFRVALDRFVEPRRGFLVAAQVVEQF